MTTSRIAHTLRVPGLLPRLRPQAVLRAPLRAWCVLVVCLLLESCYATPRPYTAAPPPHREAAGESPVRTRRFNELFLEAVRQKEAGNLDKQQALLDTALSIHPDASEALYEMAVLKLSYSSYADTLARAEGDSLLWRAVALEPYNPYYKATLGAYLANSARYREAIRLYEEMADAKLTGETLATLIWLYKQSGDYAGAIRTINRLERIEGHSEALSMEKFQTYLAMNDDEHAYGAIEELCAEYPLDLRYRVLLGDLYDQQGYHERALDIYRDVLAAEPDNSYAQLSLLAYYKAADADSLYRALLHHVVLNPHTQGEARLEALKSYAIDNINRHADPAPVKALFSRALAMPQDSRELAELYLSYLTAIHAPQDSLIPVVRRLLEVEPDYSKARLQWLQWTLQRNDMAQAVDICKAGELYDPDEITFYYYEGLALFRLGRDDEAARALERGGGRVSEQTDPLLASDLYALLGDVLYESRRHDEAFAAYDRALELNANNLICLNNYAYYLSAAGRELERAEQMSKRTVDADLTNPTYLDTYAWILYQLRQYTLAQIYMREALRYVGDKPEDASLYDHAGDIAYRCGERTQALTLWKKAQTLTADPALRKRLRQKVSRRRP